MEVKYLSHMGDDNMVVDNARVSFAKQASQYTIEQNTKLIKYLAAHNHWTPFACCQIRLHVKVPLFLARQYFKHQVGSTKNEVSRRYVDDTPEFWVPTIWRSRPDKNIKQGSGRELNASAQSLSHADYSEVTSNTVRIYQDLLDRGVAPEQARAVLPQGMYTEFIDTGSLVYWARVYNQRSDPTAQREWVDVCEQIDVILRGLFPISWTELTMEVMK